MLFHMKILSRVCAEFKDKQGNVIYRIGPADRLVYRDDAPEAIKDDLLFGALVAEGSIDVIETAAEKKAGERPALVLDLTSVLFTSSAVSGYKASAPEDGSSFGHFSGSDDPYEGNRWREEQKMTLPDENFQAFTAQGNDPDRAAVSPDGTVEISFTNALTDTETEQNRYVSAMLCDSEDEVIGYASIKPEASSGTWVLTLPPGLDVSEKEYTLKVFNEQQNGIGCTDFASSFSIIPLTKATVPEFGTPDLTMPAELRTIEANAFEGVTEITAVDARNCTYIGEEAFKGCTELTQIMVDTECGIEENAFSTDGTVWVYADGEGAAKTFCDTHEGFEYVQVEQGD